MSQFESTWNILNMFTGISSDIKLNQVMPDIVTFAEHPEFCGKSLYPKQRTILRIMFLEEENFTEYDRAVIDDWIEQSKNFEAGADVQIPLDIYERIRINKAAGRKHFKELIDVGGRRGGKGYLGGITAAYKALEMVYLDNPQAYFGIDPDKDIYINVVATNESQAKKYLFADIATTILGCKALQPYILKAQGGELRMQTPADKRKVAEYKKHGMKVERDIASVRVIANAASGTSIRGGAAIMQAFDEFAFQMDSESSRGGEEIYEAATPSLKQMGNSSLIYVPSSPYSKIGKFYELYTQALEQDEDKKPKYPEMFVIQHPSWTAYEDWEHAKDKEGNALFDKAIIELDHDLLQLERRNPDKFRVEYRARFASTIDAYLSPDVVDRAFENDLRILPSGNPNTSYRFHADPGKSQDAYCVAGGHSYVSDDGYYHVAIDYMKAYQAKDFPVDPVAKVPWVDYNFINDDIIKTCSVFNVSVFSYDQFSSINSIQTVRSAVMNGKTYNRQQIVKEFTSTKQSNAQVADVFKTSMYMGLVHIPDYYVDVAGAGMINLPMEEMKFLQVKAGRVDHQSCFPADTMVRTNNGVKRIVDLDEDSDMVYAISADRKEIVEVPFKGAVKTTSVSTLMEIETEDGKIIQCTDNHPILTQDGYKQAKDLTENDSIICVPDFPLNSDKNRGHTKQNILDKNQHVISFLYESCDHSIRDISELTGISYGHGRNYLISWFKNIMGCDYIEYCKRFKN